MKLLKFIANRLINRHLQSAHATGLQVIADLHEISEHYSHDEKQVFFEIILKFVNAECVVLRDESKIIVAKAA